MMEKSWKQLVEDVGRENVEQIREASMDLVADNIGRLADQLVEAGEGKYSNDAALQAAAVFIGARGVERALWMLKESTDEAASDARKKIREMERMLDRI
jgi:predicted negative regulator of RcsB-dependent stress response